jgi:hypothetical protein
LAVNQPVFGNTTISARQTAPVLLLVGRNPRGFDYLDRFIVSRPVGLVSL